MILKKAIKIAAEFVYPPNIYCMSCGNIIDGSRPYSLCDSCVKTFHWSLKGTCLKCGKQLRVGYDQQLCPDCVAIHHLFEKGFSCVEYGDAERMLIHRFKYKDEPHLMKPMAEAMYDRLASVCPEVDLIVPVPMFKAKERERGYNQAYLLAKELSGRMGVPCSRSALLRVLETEAMSSLGAEARRENIKGAFGIEKGREGEIAEKNILLVDDIYTTGSTADACAEVLLACGAGKVYIYAFAAGK